MQSPHSTGPPSLPFGVPGSPIPSYFRGSYTSPSSFYNVPGLKSEPVEYSPAHYVTPFTTDTQALSQAGVSQPGAAIGGIPTAHVVTTGYDFNIAQAQAIYTQQVMASSGGADPRGLTATRASPQTIKWLFENYETAEGVSLPRSTLYNHYLRHCAANKIDAINAASFGKLIRSVFIGLKTRRLGTRGNSKYHYYGIRIKPDSPLNTYPTDDSPAVAMRQPSAAQKDYRNSDSGGGDNLQENSGSLTPQQQHHQYLGENRPDMDAFPEIEWEGTPVPEGISMDDLSDFIALYREHCEAILDVVTNLQFQMVENLWQLFWGSNIRQCDSGDDENEHRMPKEKLLVLTNCQPIIDYLTSCDHILYQCIVGFLIPNVLRPIPATLTQAIRNFAKSLESWMKGSLDGYPALCVQNKVSSVVAFSQTLRRYTSLNHLAQAARAVLQNSSQINQMVTDLNRVDFANVQEQASWVCQCDESLVTRLEQDFKTTLQQQNSLEQWAVWLEGVVNTILQPYEGTPEYPKAARQFLLKWSFYSSMVIRDLTLRSAASFGSFHLIRLLYDEYMFYLIEHKVARSSSKTPITVMTEFSSLAKNAFDAGSSDHSLSDDVEAEPPTKKQRV